jgi:hypothetical protein
VIQALRAALLLILTGCARILAPPGGPGDKAPPYLLSTRPDSIEVLPGFKGAVEFRFDNVVSEGTTPNFGFGNGDLERLVILSPSARVPVVRWRRDRITVRPGEGWRPNTVYRVELLPGVVDLSNNRSKNGRTITFTTGAPLPTKTVRGLVVDWATQRPLKNALVEAVLQPDSLPYRTTADSLGRFELGPLPPGEYLIYGVTDQNNDRRRQSRELYDSVRTRSSQDNAGEIWVFRHDSTAARITSAAPNDSLSLVLTFSQNLNPYQRLPADSVQVRLLPDSVPVPVLAILPKGQYDTAYPPPRSADTARARADSVRAHQDSVRADSVTRAQAAAAIRIAGTQRRRAATPDTMADKPLKTKPPLFDKLYVRVGQKLAPGARYAVTVHGIQNASRVPGTARSVAPIPLEKPPSDSTKTSPDSLRAKPDTVKKPPSRIR